MLLFLPSLQSLPVAAQLRSKTGRGTLRSDLLRLELSLDSDNFDFDRIKPLLKAAVTDNLDDTNIWDQVDRTVTESTPPPQPIASSIEQTPWLHKTSSFANSSERRDDVDPVLKSELGPFCVGIRCLREKFFGRVAGLEAASLPVFNKCTQGSAPLFGAQEWSDWPGLVI